MPLEFSRISKDGRLTLVIDCQSGTVVDTYYAVSPRVGLDDAVHDLAVRECTSAKHIGSVDSVGHSNPTNGRAEQALACAKIRSWIAANDFDAAVWTALDSNFESKTGHAFSVENAIDYLQALPAAARERALNYFKNAPPEIDTPLRRKLLDLMSRKSEIDPARQP